MIYIEDSYSIPEAKIIFNRGQYLLSVQLMHYPVVE
jgi:hypothetical protein